MLNSRSNGSAASGRQHHYPVFIPISAFLSSRRQKTRWDHLCLSALSRYLASAHPTNKWLHSQQHPCPRRTQKKKKSAARVFSPLKLATTAVLTTCRSDTAASRRGSQPVRSLHASPPHRYSRCSQRLCNLAAWITPPPHLLQRAAWVQECADTHPHAGCHLWQINSLCVQGWYTRAHLSSPCSRADCCTLPVPHSNTHTRTHSSGCCVILGWSRLVSCIENCLSQSSCELFYGSFIRNVYFVYFLF